MVKTGPLSWPLPGWWRALAWPVAAALTLGTLAPASAQSAPYCQSGQAPTFVLGFATLKRQLADVMGEPIECEHANPENGDALQQTTTGLAFYRRATNTPTFTNGFDHWGLTDAGLVYWTGDAIDPPGVTPPASAACDVKEVKLLAEGGDQDWSHARDVIAFDKADASGTWQIYTVRPDGSGELCLSCGAAPGGPRVDRNKGHPAWHPSGEWIVAQVEMDEHVGVLGNARYLSEPGRGWWSNLYAASADGQRWFRLTNYSPNRVEGVLIPRFSRDGSQLFWTKLVAKPDRPDDWNRLDDQPLNPFGYWRMSVADFVVGPGGVPRLANERDVTPSGGVFFESGGFAPTGNTLIFSADLGLTTPYGLDIWTLDLTTGQLTNLTGTPTQWDEHPRYSPSGQKISFMSSQPYASFDVANIRTLRTELFVMNADGSDKRQLTYFNIPGAPEYSAAEPLLAVDSAWSADGTRLMVAGLLFGRSYPKRLLYLVSFTGPCGA